MTYISSNSQRYENERIHLLECSGLLDTEASESFDQITRLASQIFDAPIALVSLVDSHRQWFKSRIGLDVPETDRRFSFCSRAIEQRGLFVVEDATRDPRFMDNPLVTGPPYIRFYAGAPLVLPSGHALGSLCIIDRKTRRFTQEEGEQLETLATFVMSQIELQRKAGRLHEITRLPNRTQMAEDIDNRQVHEPGGSRGMLLVDVLDHQNLQDAVRAVGVEPLEATLRTIASNLQTIVGAGWPVYHVSETRFCVKMKGETRAEREAFCLDVITKLELPFESAGMSVQLEVAAGLVDFRLDEPGGTDPLRRATSALHEARARGQKCLWHDPERDVIHTRSYELIKDVPLGLLRAEFRLVYQPKFQVGAGRYTGVEALARWTHPVFGNVSPAEFIPLVEKTALIHDFTRWAIEAAVSQIAKWRGLGLELSVAVNVSALNLEQPGFLDFIKDICAHFGVHPRCLNIECTENAVMTGAATLTALTEIRKLGCEISLDDFGMGYSNLACLRSLPIQLLKLDQSLIKPIDSNPKAAELVKSLVQLGQSLGFRVLAEGVETDAACKRLLEFGCDAMQGYFLARPMEADAVPTFMAAPPVDPSRFMVLAENDKSKLRMPAKAASVDCAIYSTSTFKSPPRHAEKIRRILRDNTALIRAQAGCLSCELFEQERSPGFFVTYERWRDRLALSEYENSSAAAQLDLQLDGLMIDKTTRNQIVAVKS